MKGMKKMYNVKKIIMLLQEKNKKINSKKLDKINKEKITFRDSSDSIFWPNCGSTEWGT